MNRNQHTGLNAERNRRIVAMVEAGATFGMAARAQLVTRNVVAGVCQRAGVKASGGSCSAGHKKYLADPDHLKRRREMIAHARKCRASVKKEHSRCL